jgi:hypothetical protein
MPIQRGGWNAASLAGGSVAQHRLTLNVNLDETTWQYLSCA